MKHITKSVVSKVRNGLAGMFACVIVLGVPVLSVVQLGHFFHSESRDTRKSTPLAAMHVRDIDKTTSAPKLFQEPLISVTFDDGYETTYTQAMPVLQEHGIHSTQYLLSGVENDPNYLNWDQIAAIQKAGHEIACHTVNHPDLRTLSDRDVMYQLTGCRTTFEQRYGSITDFASPYGSADDRTRAHIGKVFYSQRNTNGDSSNGVTDADVNLKETFDPHTTFDKMNIIGMTVKRDTKPEEIQALIDFTVKNNGWLVLTYHQADDGPSQFGLDPKKLDEQMSILEKSPVRIVTVHDALSQWKEQ